MRDRIVALAPRASDWAQLGTVLRAMAGTEADVLGKSVAYRELVAYLPGKPLATVYYAGSESALRASTAESVAVSGRMAVGVYARKGVIDLAFRGASHRAPGQAYVTPAGMERMLKLPETTLGAILTTVDWPSMASQGDGGAMSTLQRYVRLLVELGKADADPGAQTPRLGRHLIIAWGQDLSAKGTIPQFTALIETPDANMMTQYARRVAVSLGRIISTLELRDVSQDFQVQVSTHLGVTISSVSLEKYSQDSRFEWVKLLGPLELSWAASGEWFMVALTRDHLHRVLDAQIGFVGNLTDHRDARGLREQSGKNISVAFLQGTQAAVTMQRWDQRLREMDVGELVAKVWATGDPGERDRLGVEIADIEHFGMVEVSAVTPSSPADGRLQPGDRVFGIDGRLLQMASPVDDLQQWWSEATPGSSHTLRVLRGDAVIELEVSRRFNEMSLDDLFARPIDLLRELSELCEAIPFSTLHVHFTGDRHTSALVSMRLATDE